MFTGIEDDAGNWRFHTHNFVALLATALMSGSISWIAMTFTPKNSVYVVIAATVMGSAFVFSRHSDWVRSTLLVGVGVAVVDWGALMLRLARHPNLIELGWFRENLSGFKIGALPEEELIWAVSAVPIDPYYANSFMPKGRTAA